MEFWTARGFHAVAAVAAVPYLAGVANEDAVGQRRADDAAGHRGDKLADRQAVVLADLSRSG